MRPYVDEVGGIPGKFKRIFLKEHFTFISVDRNRFIFSEKNYDNLVKSRISMVKKKASNSRRANSE
jgi:hypothetical protein